MSNWGTNSRDAWSKAWSKDNLGGTIGAGVSGLTGIASTFGETARLKEGKINELDNQIDDINNTQFGYGDYDSLQSAFINPQISDFSAYDLRQSDGERAVSTLKGIGSGAMAGATIGGPIGAVIGGAAGLVSGLVGSFTGNRKAKREAERLNEEAEEAKNRYLANFSNNAEQISQNKFNTAALNLAAFGGMLKNNNIDNFTKSKVRLAAFGGDMFSPIGREDGFTNGVVKVNEGGSHETNPYDGVLMGVDPAGTPNLVEEGEVLFNDYVFSNRLYPTGGQLESVRLPKRYEGKSYSEIAWDLQKESQLNPLDKISRNTLIDSMAKLTTLQEQSRERDRENTEFNEYVQLAAKGGFIKPSHVGRLTDLKKRTDKTEEELWSEGGKDVRKMITFARNARKWNHAFGGNLYAGGSVLDGLKKIDSQAAKEQMKRNIERAFGRDGFQGFGSGEFGGAGASGRFVYDPEGVTMFDYVRNTPIPIETSFSDAYAQARRDGLKTFMFNGKEYTTGYDPNAKLGPREYETTIANLRQVLDENRREIPDSTRIEPWVGQIPGEHKRTRAFGGPMGNMYPDGSQLRTFRAPKVTLNLKDTFKLPEEKETDITSSTNEMFDNQNRWLDDFGNYYWGKHNIDESDKRHNRLLSEAADYANGYMGHGWFNGNSLAQTLRAVPVVGSAINYLGDAVGWRNKEDYTWSDRIGQSARTIRNVKAPQIGGYMSYNPYDVDYEMNRLQNVGLGTQRALFDTAGGNSLAARNAMLALNNNITSQMGEARRGAAAANEERRKGVQQFNTGIDQFNAGQSLNSQIYNQRADEERVDDIIKQAMLADSIQSATSQARSTEETAALNNAGQWGNDMMYNDMARYYLEHIAPNNDATRDASWILGRRYGAKGGKIKRSNIKEFKKK